MDIQRQDQEPNLGSVVKGRLDQVTSMGMHISEAHLKLFNYSNYPDLRLYMKLSTFELLT